MDRGSVDCNCILPNKTSTRTTASNNGASTINADANLKPTTSIFFVCVSPAKRLFHDD
jgi:hypothetical protein